MLIPKTSPLECSSSSFRCIDFRMIRPAIKAKHRSIVPTTSSLLADVILEPEQMNEAMDYAEGHPAKIHDMEQNLPITAGVHNARDELHRDSNSYGKSERTEDIFIREDENGIRSHFCPLNPELDGEKEENEDLPDRPMKMPSCVEKLLSSYCLASEEIHSLVAEKPSGSEESETSSYDSSTSVKYSPLQNQLVENENAWKFRKPISRLKEFLTSPKRVLDEKIMKEWEEDSSDEYDDECYAYRKDFEMTQNYTTGNESDMEEFEEDSGEKIEMNNLISPKISENEDEDPKDLSIDRKSSENNAEKEKGSNSECFTNLSKTESFNDEGDKNCQPSNLNENMKENNSECGHTAKDKHSEDDDSRNKTESKINSEEEEDVNKEEKLANDSESNFTVKNRQCANVGVEKCLLNVFNKTDESPQECFNNSCPEILWGLLDEDTKAAREGNEAKLAMEPVAMNISRFSQKDESQPDVTTRLPLVTEAYCTKEDEELFSEKFSPTHVVDEVSVKEKAEVFEKLQGFERRDNIDHPVLKSAGQSSTLEPVFIKDDQKVTPKSQNKFINFFQSVKRKLERAKKA